MPNFLASMSAAIANKTSNHVDAPSSPLLNFANIAELRGHHNLLILFPRTNYSLEENVKGFHECDDGGGGGVVEAGHRQVYSWS